MSAELDEQYGAMNNNKVPANWAAVAYPSLKPLTTKFVFEKKSSKNELPDLRIETSRNLIFKLQRRFIPHLTKGALFIK